jgi:hypothetical protein
MFWFSSARCCIPSWIARTHSAINFCCLRQRRKRRNKIFEKTGSAWRRTLPMVTTRRQGRKPRTVIPQKRRSCCALALPVFMRHNAIPSPHRPAETRSDSRIAVYLPCTPLQRLGGFYRLCPFLKSITYLFLMSRNSSTPAAFTIFSSRVATRRFQSEARVPYKKKASAGLA